MTKSQIIKSLESRRKAIAKERDRLRDALHGWESLLEDCDEAIDCIDQAVEALSRLQ